MSITENIQSGMLQMFASFMNITPEQMKASVLGFAGAMEAIEKHLADIKQEQARQAALMERLNIMLGNDGGSHGSVINGRASSELRETG